MFPEDAAQQPALAHIIGVDDTAAAKLDTLTRVVDPGEVDVEGGLNQAKDDLDGLGRNVVDIELADDPVQHVQTTVQAQSEEVIRVDDGGNGSLAEEEKLWEDADRFEDVGEVPEPLKREKSVAVSNQYFGGGGAMVQREQN